MSAAPTEHPLFPDLMERFPIYFPHVAHDATTALLATATAVIVALSLAQIAVFWRRAAPIMAGVAALTQAIPMIAIGPLMVLTFGFGYSTKVLIAALICFYPVMVSVIDAVGGMRRRSEWAGDNLHLGGMIRFRLIYSSCIADGVGSGIKTTFTLSVIGAILADFILPTEGLGRLINMARVQYDLTTMYSAILLAAVLGIFFYGLGELCARAVRSLVRLATS